MCDRAELSQATAHEDKAVRWQSHSPDLSPLDFLFHYGFVTPLLPRFLGSWPDKMCTSGNNTGLASSSMLEFNYPVVVFCAAKDTDTHGL